MTEITNSQLKNLRTSINSLIEADIPISMRETYKREVLGDYEALDYAVIHGLLDKIRLAENLDFESINEQTFRL